MISVTSHLGKRHEPQITYCPLALIAAALSGGIVLDRLFSFDLAGWLIAGWVFLAIWLALWFAGRIRASSGCLLLALFATGGGWHHSYWKCYPANEIGRMAREMAGPCCVEGIAVTSPRWIPEPAPSPLRTIPVSERCELLIDVNAIRDRQSMRPATGRAELTVAGLVDRVRAGDRLRIFAQITRPSAPLNPGEFDFAAHERGQRVNCRLRADGPACVERLARGSGWSVRRLLADLRASGVEILRRHIAAERAGLAAAVLLGAREQLDAESNEDYLVTGTVHVLSISGLHVGILAGMWFWLLNSGLFSRRVALLATIVLTVAYAALTDLQPPVVRAAILVSATCLALWHGRLSQGLNTLAGALLVVLAMNPASLFQVGTQLSFMAVATMIAFAPVLSRKPIDDPLDRLIAVTRPLPQRLARSIGDGVWRLWLTGLLIWIISTPLVWRHYHLMSPVALVLNCLIWLPITLVMYGGLATLVFGGAAPVLGQMCGYFCDRCLWLVELLIVAGRNWPASHYWLAPPPAWWVGVFYLVLGTMFLFPALRPSKRWIIAIASMWFAGAIFFTDKPVEGVPWLKPRPLVCHFVAVGHGLGVIVELPDGRKLLYDTGHLGSPLAAVRPLAEVLWSRGITHLDAVIISHADADHFNGIPGLLERFDIGRIYVSPVMFDSPGPAVDALRAAISASGVAIQELYSGQRLSAGLGTTIEVLHPPRKGVYGSDNANSITLLIEYAGRRVLLTGDLESPGLEDVLAEEPLHCDIVLAPHHGSPRSSPGGTVPL